MRIHVNCLCFIVVLGVLSLLSCKGKTDLPETEKMLNDIDIKKLATLSEKKVFFGHQSIGFNIISGMQSILQLLPDIKLNLREVSTPGDFTGAVFGHARIGRNGYPLSKVDDFKKKLEGGIADSVDIALMKFCFVDFNSQTDAHKIFEYYKSTMAKLATEYPKVRFIHCTVPLEAGNTGIKGIIKIVLGKNENVLANARREEYNRLIRDTYKDALFDIAAIESRKKEGSIATSHGTACLLDFYTDDGAHLNLTGRRVAAIEFLKIICSARCF